VEGSRAAPYHGRHGVCFHKSKRSRCNRWSIIACLLIQSSHLSTHSCAMKPTLINPFTIQIIHVHVHLLIIAYIHPLIYLAILSHAFIDPHVLTRVSTDSHLLTAIPTNPPPPIHVPTNPHSTTPLPSNPHSPTLQQVHSYALIVLETVMPRGARIHRTYRYKLLTWLTMHRMTDK
jgi:hypothetical protein